MSSRTPVIAAGLGHAVKAAVAGALIAGCGFEPSGLTPGDGAAADARAGDGGDASDRDAPDGPTATPLCDLGDANLILCLPFDDGTPRNRATSNLQPQTVVDVSAGGGRVGLGGGLGDTTVLHFPEDSRLDLVQPFAFEMFVRLDEAPATTGNMRIGLLDNDGQFSAFARLRDNGTGPRIYPYCNAQGTAASEVALVIGTWHHVACVQDAGTLSIYVDGVVATVANPTPIDTGNNRGTTVGADCDADPATVDDGVIGAIDELRLWRGVARTSAEIQAAAARR